MPELARDLGLGQLTFDGLFGASGAGERDQTGYRVHADVIRGGRENQLDMPRRMRGQDGR